MSGASTHPCSSQVSPARIVPSCVWRAVRPVTLQTSGAAAAGDTDREIFRSPARPTRVQSMRRGLGGDCRRAGNCARRARTGVTRRTCRGVSPATSSRCVCRGDGRQRADLDDGRRLARPSASTSARTPAIDVDALVVTLCSDRKRRHSCGWRACSSTTATRPKISCRRRSSGWPASAHRIQDLAKAPAYLRSIVLNLARDHNRRGLVSLRHHLPRDDQAAVDDADHAARRPAAGHRCAARAPASPARLPRAAVLRRARHRRHRDDARHLPQLREDAPRSRARRARTQARPSSTDDDPVRRPPR